MRRQSWQTRAVGILLLILALGLAASTAMAEPIRLTHLQMDEIAGAAAHVINKPGLFRLRAVRNATKFNVLIRGHRGRLDYNLTETPTSFRLTIRGGRAQRE